MPAILEEADAFVDLTDPELDGRWLDWKAAGGTDRRRPDDRLRHRRRPRGHLLPRRPVQEGRPADRPRRGRRRSSPTGTPTSPTGKEFVDDDARRRLVRLLQGHQPGHDQPARVPLRGRRQQRRRAREPRGQGRSSTRSPRMQATGLATNLDQWSDDWVAAFQNDGFATMACPRLDARRHRGQRRRRRGLGPRQHLPRRRRQLGRLLPRRARRSPSTPTRPRRSPRG